MLDVWIRVMGIEMEGNGCMWGTFLTESTELANEFDAGGEGEEC